MTKSISEAFIEIRNIIQKAMKEKGITYEEIQNESREDEMSNQESHTLDHVLNSYKRIMRETGKTSEEIGKMIINLAEKLKS